MTCADVSAQVIDYLYGALNGPSRRALDEHVAGCGRCRNEVTSLQAIRAQVNGALHGVLNEEAPARVRGAVMDAAQARQFGGEFRRVGWGAWLRRPWFVPAFAAASLMGIFALTRGLISDPHRLQRMETPAARNVAPEAPTQDDSAKSAPSPRLPAPTAAQPVPMEKPQLAREAGVPARTRHFAEPPPAQRGARQKTSGAVADDEVSADARQSSPRAAAARAEEMAVPPAAGASASARGPGDALGGLPAAPGPLRSRNQGVAGESLPVLRDRAAAAFAGARWQEAEATYRELARRFPDHKDVALWRQRATEAAQRLP